MQPVAVPEDEYWVKGFGTKYLDYDVAEANRRLDAAGLTKRGSDGMRLRPDGKKLQINVLTFPLGVGVPVIDGYEYVQRHWKAVGIHMEIQNVSQDLFYKKAPAGDYDFCGYGSAAGYHWDIDPLWYVPTSSYTYWACSVRQVVRDQRRRGREADRHLSRPAGLVRRAALDRRPQPAARSSAARSWSSTTRTRWILGIVRIPFQPIVVSNDMVNVRKDAVSSYRTGLDESTLAEQIYFRSGIALIRH